MQNQAFCSKHLNQKLIKFCVDPECKGNRFFCKQCQKPGEAHNKHKSENIEQFQSQLFQKVEERKSTWLESLREYELMQVFNQTSQNSNQAIAEMLSNKKNQQQVETIKALKDIHKFWDSIFTMHNLQKLALEFMKRKDEPLNLAGFKGEFIKVDKISDQIKKQMDIYPKQSSRYGASPFVLSNFAILSFYG